MSTKSRSIRNRVRRNKAPMVDIDITSLMDVVTILICFLLTSYNSSGLVVNVAEDIKIPTSSTSIPGETGVIIQVSSDSIWVEEKKVLDPANPPAALYDQSEMLILPLYEELVALKETIEMVSKSSPQAKPFQGIANLVMDKDIKYDYMKKVLHTIAEAGFQKYKLIVQGESM